MSPRHGGVVFGSADERKRSFSHGHFDADHRAFRSQRGADDVFEHERGDPFASALMTSCDRDPQIAMGVITPYRWCAVTAAIAPEPGTVEYHCEPGARHDDFADVAPSWGASFIFASRCANRPTGASGLYVTDSWSGSRRDASI